MVINPSDRSKLPSPLQPNALSLIVSKGIVAILTAYRLLLSPLFPPACRFHPTCSEYAVAAFKKHSLAHAVALTLKRILRCHPWSKGGFDPLP
ncbi:MAG: membrane protein insertion efficiency factor YidD [Fidelibacterota bacterium]